MSWLYSEILVVLTNYQLISRASSDWYGLFPGPEYKSVSLDTHEYQCFGGYWNGLADKDEGWGLHLDASCNFHQQVGRLERVTELS